MLIKNISDLIGRFEIAIELMVPNLSKALQQPKRERKNIPTSMAKEVLAVKKTTCSNKCATAWEQMSN